MGTTAKWLEFAVLYFGLFFCGVLTGIFLLFYDPYDMPAVEDDESNMETLKLFDAYKDELADELLPESTTSRLLAVTSST